jgi:hypothetical protein
MATITLAPVPMRSGVTKAKLVAPYHPDLPARAKALGGTWDPAKQAWYFDQRDTRRVADLALDLFGIDPLGPPAELVTVRVDLDQLQMSRYDSPPELYFAGRCVARRPARDAAVTLGPGVILIRGGFPAAGGTAKHPSLAATPGTVIEVRDIPRPAAEAERQRRPGAVTAVEDAPAPALPAIEDQIKTLFAQLSPERREALLAELAAAVAVTA